MNDTELADLRKAISEESPINAAMLMNAYREFSVTDRLHAAKQAGSPEERQAALDEGFERACALMAAAARAQAENADANRREWARQTLAKTTIDLGFAQADYAAALDYPMDTAIAAARNAVDNELAGNGALH